MELKGKNILVIGLGKTGIAAARFAAERGAAVTATDDKPEAELREALGDLEGLPLRVFTGGADAAVVVGQDLVVPSPGVPPFNPLIREAERRGLPVVSETELAFRFLRVPVIAITGTNGKRIFRMAPIHHHFELKGWAEPKVIVRFWIISIILALVAISTLKLR